MSDDFNSDDDIVTQGEVDQAFGRTPSEQYGDQPATQGYLDRMRGVQPSDFSEDQPLTVGGFRPYRAPNAMNQGREGCSQTVDGIVKVLGAIIVIAVVFVVLSAGLKSVPKNNGYTPPAQSAPQQQQSAPPPASSGTKCTDIGTATQGAPYDGGTILLFQGALGNTVAWTPDRADCSNQFANNGDGTFSGNVHGHAVKVRVNGNGSISILDS